MYLLNLYAHCQLDENPGWFKTLFIDSTLIKNLAGTDCVGRNPTDRGLLGSKVSVLCDVNRITFTGCVLYPANHADCKTVEDTFELSVLPPANTTIAEPFMCLGGKAHNSKEKFVLCCRAAGCVRLQRTRNAKVARRLSPADRKNLKKRHLVENLFCRLKQFKRLRHRMDTPASAFHAEFQAAFCILLVQQIQS
jgi:hypothetical protein